MSSNQKYIIDKYGDGQFEESRGLSTRPDYVAEFHYTKKLISEYITPECSVAEIGCGTGYYGMFLSDQCSEYLGVDIVPGNISVFSEKIRKNNLINVKACVGDATDLSFLDSGSFDVVLVLGPMYHLPPEEREKVFDESKRICKDNGTLIYAYTNKVGVYLRGCLSKGGEKLYPNSMKNIALLQKGIDDTRHDIYFFTMPEDMEKAAAEHGLTVIKNLGVDFTALAKPAGELSDEQVRAWTELFDFMCGSPSCTGFSNHALLVCRKGR